MLKDGQAIMGLKIYEKEATQNKHMKARTKQTKNQGFWVTTSRTLEQACICIIKPACTGQIMHTQILAQKNLKTQKQNRTLNNNSNNLTCRT